MDDQGSDLMTMVALIGTFSSLGVAALGYIFYPAYVSMRRHEVDVQFHTLPWQSSSDQDQEILLSIVIPAYNEERRLLSMLHAAESYLSAESCCGLELLRLARKAKQGHTTTTDQSTESEPSIGSAIEWIVVNDGSSDETTKVYTSYVLEKCKLKNPKDPTMIWRLCSLSENSGKGAAVQAGMLYAKGQFRLMVDADGATDFGPGLEALAQFAQSHNFVFGSRAVPEHGKSTVDKSVQRSWIRQLFQAGFHTFVVVIVGNNQIYDTQCGFKLFWGDTAQILFRGLHLPRWSFDIELFVRARHLDLNMKEIGVPWQEIEGSKLGTGTLSLIRVAVGMLRDMICVRLCYSVGIWKIDRDENVEQLSPFKKYK